MASIINAPSFKAAAEQPDHNFWVEGTAEVTLRNETRRVRATKCTRTGFVKAFGMTGRYNTGTVAWPASVEQRIDPRTNQPWDHIQFGRDDRAAKFQKTSALYFA